MPAILRIFVYQTDASPSVIGSTTPYDQGADLSRHGLIWNNMRCLPCEVSVADVLGIAQEAQYETVECE